MSLSGIGPTIKAECTSWKAQARDFVKAHGLQAGDYFIIYRSSATENYVVRGTKGVRPPTFALLAGLQINCGCGIQGALIEENLLPARHDDYYKMRSISFLNCKCLV